MGLDIWLKKDECKTCGRYKEVFESNITHNLTSMADMLGIYELLWCPAEVGISKAKQLIKPLRRAIKEMKDKPDYYKKFNAVNSWGTYEHFLPWLENLLEACENNPDCTIGVSV